MTSTTSLPLTWDSPPLTGTRFGRWWDPAPRITAESLLPVPDPLLTRLAPGPVTAPAAVARAIAQSLLPQEDPATPPAWLLTGQQRSFRRALAAIRRYRAALLADPVGSGKTFVALAAAWALNGRGPTSCLVPAALVPQWRAVASRLAVAVEIGSHEQASRGRLPPRSRGLVIVDESHHYRNPATRRYGFAAQWLVGRRVLLVSATPIVNRLDDLLHQLRLGVRDDALAACGISSLHRAIAERCDLSALSQLVIEEHAAAAQRPALVSVVSPADQLECTAVARAMERIGRLTLSRHAPTAALVRGVLQRAAGSSPAALLSALRRYRMLLLHARDARASGRTLRRAEIRRFAGELEEQLVLWSLVGGEEGEPDLDLGDLEVLSAVIAESAMSVGEPDPKLARLSAILADARPTLVFVTSRETVRHLRDRLDSPPVAWCTGDRAGLGGSALSREVVLGWFRAGSALPTRPAPEPLPHLIATDVAAEGLDLQHVARVVHYDPPWTPMRLAQREGRAIRLGSEHRIVEVVRFLPPPVLEAALHMEAGLSRKERLPGLAGIGGSEHRRWRWRVGLADILGSGAGRAGVGLVPGSLTGVVAGFTLHADLGGRDECLAAMAGWMSATGEWSEDPEVVARMLLIAARVTETLAPDECRVRESLAALAGPIRAHLSVAGGRRWAGAEPEAAARRLTGRLRQAARSAARRRDLPALERLERALAFTGGGHTAGEAALVRRLADSPAHELALLIAPMPPTSPKPEAVEVRLSGLVFFGE